MIDKRLLRQGDVQAILRTDFISFVEKVFYTLNPGVVLQANWHLDAICYALMGLIDGDNNRLVINAPPRSLKSVIASVALPAFLLGRDPTVQIICVSYSSELAHKFSNDFRRIVTSRWYRDLFPLFLISSFKNTEAEVATTQGGGRLSVSVGGTITGRGADVIAVDDSMKPEDALSEKTRESVNRWFASTLLSRLNNKKTGKIVLIGQRIHQDDLSGKLIAEGVPALILPAIAMAEETIPIGKRRYHHRYIGDLLHPERESKIELDTLRRSMGTDIFAAQYQQEPVPPGGNMIKRSWIKRYHLDDIDGEEGTIIQSWDTASKAGGQNDYSVCTTWFVADNGHYYLLHVFRDRLNYPELKARAIKLFNNWPGISSVMIEDAGVGTALVPELCEHGIPAIAVKSDRDKVTRMSVQTGKIEAGFIHFPENESWLADLEAELFAFPNSRHDDQVDSVSQALGHVIWRPMWNEKNVGTFPY
ncbi:terminase-like family protein [Variibacter gotjawalensis]|uniref:Terminase-like family protein n=1 Tax=Variibacter gotjawalensis TaxID=1333996 RepID=A0A0S3PRH2_9BRAD|nr:phage terminase large subunit [Variibacter gotjawalensis]NIK48860.1 putative phage terminase large subunit-like protein [Variibacter gotjawalensis]RZS50718.1 putative phage terminase large subunit-like protein [Variibacter gotjawalensis]BAT58554.1 terminase-like family protein [Variibacter gotjawalensis]